MPLAKVFTAAGVDAETALIKSILERHGATYSMHDVRKPEEAARAERLTKGSELRVPFVLLGRKTVWLATEMPELERAGSLKLAVTRERQLKHAGAQYSRGLLHLRGQGALARDPLAALEWFERAATYGDPKGQCALGSLLMSGEVGLKDADAARGWFEAAAQQGSTSARLALGQLELQRASRRRADRQIVSAASTAEDATALAAAAAHFQAAADAGSSQGWVWLARTAEVQHKARRRVARLGLPMGGEDDSLETARQTDEVEAYLRMAATMDNPEGAFLLAKALCGGALPPQPGAALTAEAKKLVETAAEQGYAPAMHVLGCALRTEDPAAALRWWQRGAGAGHAAARAAEAQAILERAVVSAAAPLGEAGTAAAEKELVHARELFERAAAAGESAGMVGLGDCHYFGRGGLAAEPLVALAWYTIAARHGSERGKAEAAAMHIALDAAQARAARPLEATLWATLGHGGGLYARARACYKEGLAGTSGRKVEPVSDLAIGDNPAADMNAARVGLSTKVVAEPTLAQGLVSACRLRWAAAILERAARRGELRALPMLARMHLDGVGVPASEEKAVAMLQRGAQRGSAASAWALGRLHWERWGDLPRSYQWFVVAEALHCKEAPPFQQLAGCLGAREAATAERRGQRWLQRHVESKKAAAAPPRKPSLKAASRALTAPVSALQRAPSGALLAPGVLLAPSTSTSTSAAGFPAAARAAAAPVLAADDARRMRPTATGSYGVAPGSYRAAATLTAAPAPTLTAAPTHTLPPAESDYYYGDYYSDDEAAAAGAMGASLSPNIAPQYRSFGAEATAMAKQDEAEAARLAGLVAPGAVGAAAMLSAAAVVSVAGAVGAVGAVGAGAAGAVGVDAGVADYYTEEYGDYYSEDYAGGVALSGAVAGGGDAPADEYNYYSDSDYSNYSEGDDAEGANGLKVNDNLASQDLYDYYDDADAPA